MWARCACSFSASQSTLCKFLFFFSTTDSDSREHTDEWINFKLMSLLSIFLHFWPLQLGVEVPPPTFPCTVPHLSHLCFIPTPRCTLLSVLSTLIASAFPEHSAILPLLLLLCMTQFSSLTVCSLCVSWLPPHSLPAYAHTKPCKTSLLVQKKGSLIKWYLAFKKKNKLLSLFMCNIDQSLIWPNGPMNWKIDKYAFVKRQLIVDRLVLVTGRNLVNPLQEQQQLFYRIKQLTQWGHKCLYHTSVQRPTNI